MVFKVWVGEGEGRREKTLSFGEGVRMGTGQELDVKLATPGWFEKVVNNNEFYYIVSCSKNF